MKFFATLLAFTFLSLFISCDDQPDQPTVPNTSSQPVTGTKINPQSGTKNGPGVEVESSTRTTDPNFNDATVNYAEFAANICECSKESSNLNIQMENLANEKKTKEFSAMTPKVANAFQGAVKCSEQKANALGGEFSPYTLVREMKGQCPDLPAELVAQILRKFGVNI